MAWDALDHKTELLVESFGSDKRPRYRLTGWIRHTRRDGNTYMEPVPNFWALRTLEFTSLESMPVQVTRRTAVANDRSLTRQTNSRTFGGRKA